MADPDRCELHETALFAGHDEPDALLRLSQSPIGDECQICPVCRSAREYVERRLAEESGYVPPPGESAEVSWGKLQDAIKAAKASIRKST